MSRRWLVIWIALAVVGAAALALVLRVVGPSGSSSGQTDRRRRHHAFCVKVLSRSEAYCASKSQPEIRAMGWKMVEAFEAQGVEATELIGVLNAL